MFKFCLCFFFLQSLSNLLRRNITQLRRAIIWALRHRRPVLVDMEGVLKEYAAADAIAEEIINDKHQVIHELHERVATMHVRYVRWEI